MRVRETDLARPCETDLARPTSTRACARASVRLRPHRGGRPRARVDTRF
jgi:hypothetical protein